MRLNTVLRVYVPTQVFLSRQVKQFVQRTDGASGIEYAVIAAMVAVVIAGFSPDIQTAVKNVFTTIKTGLTPPA